MSASRKISTQMAERRDTYNQVQEITARIKQAAQAPPLTLEERRWLHPDLRPDLRQPLGMGLRASVDNRGRRVDSSGSTRGSWEGARGEATGGWSPPPNHSLVVPHPPPARFRDAADLSPESTSPNTPTDHPST